MMGSVYTLVEIRDIYLAQWQRKARKHCDHLDLIWIQIRVKTHDFDASGDIRIIDLMVMTKSDILYTIMRGSSVISEMQVPGACGLDGMIALHNRVFVVAIEPTARSDFDIRPNNDGLNLQGIITIDIQI
jgi:hypothetical protein